MILNLMKHNYPSTTDKCHRSLLIAIKQKFSNLSKAIRFSRVDSVGMAEVSEQNWILESYPWITSGFVENIIKNAEQDENVALKSFNVKKAFKNGENFSSQIVTLRVIFHSKIEGSVEKEKDYLMKIAIQTDDLAKIYEECLVYEREIAAYTIVLPAVEECFNAIGLSARIAPRYFESRFWSKIVH